MGRGHVCLGCVRWLYAVLALVASPLLPSPQSALAADPPGAAAPERAERVLVLVLCAEGVPCRERVAGQLADLPGVEQRTAVLDLEQARALVTQAAPPREFDVLAILLERREPTLVPEAAAGAYSVVRYRDGREIYRRRLGPELAAGSVSEDSATLEMFALGVRSAVKSLVLERAERARQAERDALEQERARAERDALEQERAAAQDAERTRGERSEPQAAPAAPAEAQGETRDAQGGQAVQLLGSLGLAALARHGESFSPSFEASLGAGVGERFELALAGRLSPPAPLDVGAASVTLTEWAVGLRARLPLFRSARTTALGELAAGVLGSARHSEAAADAELATSPDATATRVVATAGIALRQRLFSDSGLELGLCVDGIPRAARLVVLDPEARTLAELRLWALQPRLGLHWWQRW